MKTKSKDSAATVAKRKRIWRHNGFLGTVAMAQKGMLSIINSDTTTPATKELAEQIDRALGGLAKLLKDRVDAN